MCSLKPRCSIGKPSVRTPELNFVKSFKSGFLNYFPTLTGILFDVPIFNASDKIKNAKNVVKRRRESKLIEFYRDQKGAERGVNARRKMDGNSKREAQRDELRRLGEKHHIGLGTVKRYTESPQRPEYTKIGKAAGGQWLKGRAILV